VTAHQLGAALLPLLLLTPGTAPRSLVTTKVHVSALPLALDHLSCPKTRGHFNLQP
jgi:hypothetical protein